MGKVQIGVVRRRDGTYKAYIDDCQGNVIWSCRHKHRYGTSNRPHQDSASKCACAMLDKVRQVEREFCRLRIYVADSVQRFVPT